ncbi:MAG TPA: hypothetical protein VGG01_24890 [Xanthobacteraceae bacterium]|jgi:hypothetical protein
MATALPAPSCAALPDLAFLGALPLIPGDDAAGYDTLLARMTADVRPGNVIEEAWTRDVADLVWEALRLRRLKAALLTACADQGMQKLLYSLDVHGNTFELSRRWAARELQAVAEVDAVLAAAGLGINHVMARTLAVGIAEIERIDRMTASAEARRAAALREIGHHREHAPFRARLGEAAAAQIADAEFVEVAAPAGHTHEAAA